jgi:CRISPR system Cascade subunit CasA
MTTYNLLREPWLPVVRADGARASIHIRDIAELQIARIDSGRGDCDIALTELLIGLLAIAFDPRATNVRWIKRWRTPPGPAEIDKALVPFEQALDFDGPGARFFQDIEDVKGDTTPVAALLIDAPAAHFVKPGGVSVLSRRGAAIVLATLQTCAPAGGAGHRTSLRGGGPLTTLVVPGTSDGAPPTLWHRLWANVPEAFGATPKEIESVFPWLCPTRVSDKSSKTPITTLLDVHKGQAFFGLPRRIRLKFEANPDRLPCDLTGDVDDVIVREYVTKPWGANYTGWGKEHPLSPSYKPKPTAPEFLPVHLKTSRVGYRQWLGFVFKPDPDASDATNPELPAAAITTFYASRAANLLGENPAIVGNARLLVAGYYLDSMKPLEFGESLLPLLGIDPELRNAAALLAHAWVEAAEMAASTIGIAVRQGLYGDNPKIAAGVAVLETAKTRFWGETEQAFFTQLQAAIDGHPKADASDDVWQLHRRDVGKAWLEAMRREALAIFDTMVPIDTADLADVDDYKTIVEARNFLTRTFAGQTPSGRKLHIRLDQPEQPKPKKAGKAKEITA